MRKMKDSGIAWIGKIPAEWKVVSIKRVAQILRGGSPRPIEQYMSHNDDGYNWIRIGDSKKGSKYICSTQRKMVPEGLSKTRLIKKGSLILSNSMSFGLPYILEIDGCIHDGWVAFSDLAVEKEFLYYYLLSDFAHTQFEQQVAGGVVLNLNIDKIGTSKILLPDRNEQHRIAAFLDEKCAHIDAVIEKTRASIDEYKKLKQAVITRAVTKGIRQGRKMKDSGSNFVRCIPETWHNQKLFSILSMRVIDGFHESPELFDSGIPYVSATAIENGVINFDNIRGFISEQYSDLCDKRYKPQMNDILMIKLGASTGSVARVKTEQRFNIWVPLAAIRCNSVTNPDFVYFALQSDYMQRQIQLSWTYGTQQTLGVKTIEGLRIILPPLPEQQEIASYLDAKTAAIDRLIAKKEQLAAEMESCKKSLIYEVVTGKREVPA